MRVLETAMNLKNVRAPRLLMKSVDILRNDCSHMALVFEFCQKPVGQGWLCVVAQGNEVTRKREEKGRED